MKPSKLIRWHHAVFCTVLSLISLFHVGAYAQSAGDVISAREFSSRGSVTCDHRWHDMAAVDPANQFGDFDSLNGVTALSPHDVWAVGQYDVFATGAYDQTLAEHWDRASWTVVPTPQPLEQTSVLSAVAAVGPKDMWAVGYGRDIGTSAPYYGLIEHWDGKTWSIVDDGAHLAVLNSIFALAKDNVWAVGSTNFPGAGVIEHWDGKTWHYEQAGSAEFRAVTALAKDDVWIVGQQYLASGGETTIALHFNGVKAACSHPESPAHSPEL